METEIEWRLEYRGFHFLHLHSLVKTNIDWQQYHAEWSTTWTSKPLAWVPSWWWSNERRHHIERSMVLTRMLAKMVEERSSTQLPHIRTQIQQTMCMLRCSPDKRYHVEIIAISPNTMNTPIRRWKLRWRFEPWDFFGSTDFQPWWYGHQTRSCYRFSWRRWCTVWIRVRKVDVWWMTTEDLSW